MNKEQLFKKIRELDEEYLNIIREQFMYSHDLARKCLTNFGLKNVLEEIKIEVAIEKEHLEEIKSNWKDLDSQKKQAKKPDVIIIDDNELSLSAYAEEYPENWKKICDSQKKQKGNKK